MAAAAGHIVTLENDQVATARSDGANVVVEVVGASGSRATLAPLAPPIPPPATLDPEVESWPQLQFFDLAVGDVDNIADSEGHPHDEVVVCYATPATGQMLGVRWRCRLYGVVPGRSSHRCRPWLRRHSR